MSAFEHTSNFICRKQPITLSAAVEVRLVTLLCQTGFKYRHAEKCTINSLKWCISTCEMLLISVNETFYDDAQKTCMKTGLVIYLRFGFTLLQLHETAKTKEIVSVYFQTAIKQNHISGNWCSQWLSVCDKIKVENVRGNRYPCRKPHLRFRDALDWKMSGAEDERCRCSTSETLGPCQWRRETRLCCWFLSSRS